jgi:hypothetical protein
MRTEPMLGIVPTFCRKSRCTRPGLVEALIIEVDLPEDLGVLPPQRRSAACEIIRHVAKRPRRWDRG